MFIKHQIRENFIFYHKPTAQFKDNTLVFRFLFPMSQPLINAALVWSQLSDDRNKYAPTKQAMIRWMDELYDASFGSYITTYGQSLALSVVFKGIEGNVVQDSEQNAAFLKWVMIILEDVLINEATLHEAKRNVMQAMKREQENHVKYALALSAQRFVDTPYALKVDGDEGVETLNLDALTDFHQALKYAPCSIFHVGQLELQTCLQHITQSRLNQAKQACDTYTCLQANVLPRLSVKKGSPQTVFVKTYATHIAYNAADYLALRLGAIALGALPTSLLFTSIRETHSLCYFINAQVIAFDGVMNIVTGIEGNHVDRVATLIDEQLQNFVDLSDDLVDQAKKMMINTIISSDDDVMSAINVVYASALKNEVYNQEILINAINAVNKSQIIAALAKCEPLSEFVLQGETHV